MKKFNMIMAAMMIAATGFAKDIKTAVFNTAPEMHCNSCENRIKNGLKFEKGVKDIKTDLETKTVTIEYDADKTNVENLVAAFAKIDYKATEAGKGAAAGEKKMGGCCKKKAAEGAAAGEKKMGGCCKKKAAEGATTAAGEKKMGGCCKKKAAEGAATAAAGDVAKFKATQMRCGGCANKVKRLLTGVEGVSNVEVDLPTKVVTVSYDKAKTSPEKMVEAFKTINYNVEQL
jgi:copper ion binding protein